MIDAAHTPDDALHRLACALEAQLDAARQGDTEAVRAGAARVDALIAEAGRAPGGDPALRRRVGELHDALRLALAQQLDETRRARGRVPTGRRALDAYRRLS